VGLAGWEVVASLSTSGSPGWNSENMALANSENASRLATRIVVSPLSTKRTYGV
jgi:hypothetical protein